MTNHQDFTYFKYTKPMGNRVSYRRQQCWQELCYTFKIKGEKELFMWHKEKKNIHTYKKNKKDIQLTQPQFVGNFYNKSIWYDIQIQAYTFTYTMPATAIYSLYPWVILNTIIYYFRWHQAQRMELHIGWCNFFFW